MVIFQCMVPLKEIMCRLFSIIFNTYESYSSLTLKFVINKKEHELCRDPT